MTTSAISDNDVLRRRLEAQIWALELDICTLSRNPRKYARDIVALRADVERVRRQIDTLGE